MDTRRHVLPMSFLIGFCALRAVRAVSGQCEIQELAGDIVGNNDFGKSVAISGDVAVVGDEFPCYPSYCAGRAYVFRLVGGLWTLEGVIVGPEPDPSIEFGDPVALDNDVIVVGARGASGNGPGSGTAHVYRYDHISCSWIHEAMLAASDGDMGDHFGNAIAIDGNVLVIGAVNDETGGLQSAGSAYVFRFDGVRWQEETKLVDPYPVALDTFGSSVAIRDDVILVGSPHSPGDNENESALVFRYDGSTWELEQELAASDILAEHAGFGISVALLEDVALIGAFRAHAFVGAAYLYQFDGSRWTFSASLEPSDQLHVQFGTSVALSVDGGSAVIGAPADSTLGFQSGAAYVFQRDEKRWIEVAKLLPHDGDSVDLFGDSVSIAQDTALVGAWDASDVGSAYVFVGLSGKDCNGDGESDACDIFFKLSEDGNGNGVPDECEQFGDLNGDGSVGIVDFLALLANWGPCDTPCPPSCAGDFNADCVIDGLDLLGLIINWA